MSDKPSRRGGPRYGNASGLRGRPTKAEPGTKHLRLEKSYSLPCSIRADTPTGICGKPAQVVIAQPHDSALDQWPTPGLWIVQPICRDCAQAMARQ